MLAEMPQYWGSAGLDLPGKHPNIGVGGGVRRSRRWRHRTRLDDSRAEGADGWRACDDGVVSNAAVRVREGWPSPGIWPRLVRAVAAVIAMLMVLAACSGGSQSSDPATDVGGVSSTVPVTQVLDRRVVVRVGSVATVESAPLHLALGGDEFSNNGVAVRPVPLGSGRAAVTGVINGSIDVGYASAAEVLSAYESGLDLRILVAGPRLGEPDHIALITREPTATSLTTLPRGTIAVPAQPILSELALRIEMAAARMGLRHFDFVAMTHDEALTALEAEEVVGAVVAEPYLRAAVHEGATVLGRPLRQLDLDLQLGYWFTSVDALRNKRQAIARTAEVLRQSYANANDFTRALTAITFEESALADEDIPNTLLLPKWGPRPDPTSIERTAQLLASYGLIGAIPDLDKLLTRS